MYSSYRSPDNNKNNKLKEKKVENVYATWPKEKNTWGKESLYPPPPSSPPPPLHLSPPKKPHLPPPPLPPPLINRKKKPAYDNAKPAYANNPFFDNDIAL